MDNIHKTTGVFDTEGEKTLLLSFAKLRRWNVVVLRIEDQFEG